MPNLNDINRLINQYFLDSERDTTSATRGKGVYPNTLMVTEQQYKDLVKEVLSIMEVSEEALPEISASIKSICGLKVVFVTHLDEPKVIRL